MLAHQPQTFTALAADWIFNKKWTVLLYAFAKLNRSRRIETRVHVDANFDLVAQGLAHGAHLFDTKTHGARRFEHLGAALRIDHAPARESVACIARLSAAFNQFVDVLWIAVMRVTDHPIARAPSQKLVNRHAQRFGLNVPQRNVDGTHSASLHAAAGEKSTAKHNLPQMFNAKGVLADQVGRHAVNRLGNSPSPTLHARLT